MLFSLLTVKVEALNFFDAAGISPRRNEDQCIAGHSAGDSDGVHWTSHQVTEPQQTVGTTCLPLQSLQ